MVEQQRLDDWFVEEVLPLEPAVMRFLRRNWRNEGDLGDLRQELYVRLYDAGRTSLPSQTKPFVFAAARNLLINHARRARVVSIDWVADLENLDILSDSLTPEHTVVAREDLRRLQSGLDRLPPRCREVVILRRVEGLSQKEAAARLGVTENTIEKQMLYGMRALIDFMLGGSGRLRREKGAPPAAAERRGRR